MSASVVNGFICYSSCDQQKARSGKDPHPKQDGSEDARNASGLPADPNSPAVAFGGALTGLNAVQPISASSPSELTTLDPQRPTVDILA